MNINLLLEQKNRNPDILDCLANFSSDEVPTPPDRANEVLDLLPKEVWENENLKWLDPGCKSGVFLREIAKRLLVGLEDKIPIYESRVEHIFKTMLYGSSITELTSYVSTRTLYCSKFADSNFSSVKFKNTTGNIRYNPLVHVTKNGKSKSCTECRAPSTYLSEERIKKGLETHAYEFIHTQGRKWFKDMKFDIIVGNPPYQLGDGGGSSATPLYNHFVEKAIELNPRYISFIIPSRWFNTGKGLGEFRKQMLSETRISKLINYPDASEIFPGPSIKGGVCYFLWDREYSGECDFETVQNKITISRQKISLGEFDVIIRNSKGINILKKVQSKNELTLKDIVSSQTPFGILSSFEGAANKSKSASIKVYRRSGISWANKSEITRNYGWKDSWKVLIPKASDGSSKPPLSVLGKPIISEPDSVCSQTYLVASLCTSEKEASYFEAYLTTKFLRFLVSLRKTTQDVKPSSFDYVPKLQMTKLYSDIELYKRYELSEDEIQFIEETIK
jgi:site-specific DNA-methyltransferase (adenine-specific)